MSAGLSRSAFLGLQALAVPAFFRFYDAAAGKNEEPILLTWESTEKRQVSIFTTKQEVVNLRYQLSNYIDILLYIFYIETTIVFVNFL
jgi:hypothetical protein